ncbi:MAG: ATP-binding protein [Rhodospirillales bacterium]|nr:ATP-binding protein [Rhodospirillales bacterium]
MPNLKVVIIDPHQRSRERIMNILTSNGHDCTGFNTIPDQVSELDEIKKEVGGILLSLSFDLKAVSEFTRNLVRSKKYKHVPLIGVLGDDPDAHNKLEWERKDFFHFLETEPSEVALLHIVETTLSSYRSSVSLVTELKTRTSAIGLITSGTFHLKTLRECEALTTMLSLACPEPTAVALGLSELLVNAVEHGNLGITYAEKTDLMSHGGWDIEVQKRLADPENCQKNVEVKFIRDEKQIIIKVTDEGGGFDWQHFLTETPVTANSRHGRGISLARTMGFTSLAYNEKGNSVTATVDLYDEAMLAKLSMKSQM